MRRVKVEVDSGCALVVLDDPERRNALSGPLVDDLVAAIGQVEERDDVGVVVITGAGRAFCAGADLRDLLAATSGDMGGVLRVYDAFLRVSACSLPTIAAVNGPAVGAGINLALACDVRVAAVSARFDCRFLSLGLHPGGGNTWMLQRLVGPQVAAALVLLGETLDGERAAEVGLVWRCVPDDDLRRAALDLAGHAATLPRELLSTAKDSLRTVASFDRHEDALDLETRRQRRSFTEPAARTRIERLWRDVARNRRDP
jgi:enoyl-CoA hydratase